MRCIEVKYLFKSFGRPGGDKSIVLRKAEKVMTIGS